MLTRTDSRLRSHEQAIEAAAAPWRTREATFALLLLTQVAFPSLLPSIDPPALCFAFPSLLPFPDPRVLKRCQCFDINEAGSAGQETSGTKERKTRAGQVSNSDPLLPNSGALVSEEQARALP